MKRITAVLMCFVLTLCFAACGASNTENKTPNASNPEPTPFEAVYNEEEHKLYHEIFFDKKGDDYEGKEAVKTGTFTTLFDEYNEVTRYYVWGYDPDDLSHDWQWELKLKNTKNLPKNGSVVEVKGKLEKSDKALDGYWFTEPEITVKSEYTGAEYDVDMSVMSSTLERVQIVNIQNHADKYQGKSIAIYGRIVSDNMLKHPYSDDSWQIHIHTEGKVPKADKMVLVTGTYSEGVINDAAVTEVSYY